MPRHIDRHSQSQRVTLSPYSIGNEMKAAGIICWAGHTILLLKRSEDSVNGGTWGLPAGKIESGEMPMECVIRELREETQHELHAQPKLLSEEYDFALFEAKTGMFQAVLNEEHTDFMWADLENLPSPLHPHLEKQLSRFTMDSKSARVIDQNDYLAIEKNPVSREGVFPYYGKMIGADEPDRIYYVYRPASELMDEEAIKSFQTIPIIDDHEMLGDPSKGFTAPEDKEMHGTTGETVFFENGVLYANLKIFSQRLRKLIEQGKKDLSLGYRAVYEKAEGYFQGQKYDFIQRRLRGNHLALVDEGRSAVSVLDEADYKFTSDNLDLKIETKEKVMEPTANNSEAMTLDKLAEIVTGLVAKVDALAPAAKDEADEKKDEKETKDEKADEKETKDEDDKKEEKETADAADVKALRSEMEAMKKNGIKSLLSEIGQRDALVAKLTPIIGTFDHADKTLSEVAAYGAEKVGLKVTPENAAAALDGFLAAKKADGNVTFAMDSKAKMPELDAYLNKANA